jgi:hypothetical protein
MFPPNTPVRRCPVWPRSAVEDIVSMLMTSDYRTIICSLRRRRHYEHEG